MLGTQNETAADGRRLHFLGHIQPARMLGRVVELDPAQHGCGRLHTEHFFKARTQMRVEVVQDQVNLAYLGVAAAQQPTDEGDEVAPFAAATARSPDRGCGRPFG